MKHDQAGPNATDLLPSEEADDFLLISVAQASPEAFGFLYQRYLERVYHYLRVHSSASEEAADLTQQVFIQAFNAINSYTPQGVPFSAWLFRIARNLLIDFERRVGSRPQPASLSDTVQRHMKAESDVETEVLKREASGNLARMLYQLPAEKRQLLALRFAAGLSAREIASIVGRSEAGVQKQLERTIRDLRSWCEEDDEAFQENKQDE